MSKVKVREATLSDSERITDLYIEMYKVIEKSGMPYRLNTEKVKEIIELKIKAKVCGVFVLEMEEKIEGFLSIDISRLDRKFKFGSDIKAFVNDIYVSLIARGNALELMKTGEKWAMKSGADIIECSVMVDNEIAHKFWGKNDFKEMGTIYYKEIRK